MAKYKIWWQSSTAIDGFPDYVKAIKAHSKRILSSNFELEIHGVDKGTTDLHFHYFEFLNNVKVVESIYKAAQQGYDAVAIGCFLDPGLDEAREIVEIPVLSLGELSMLFACMYGKCFGVVTYVPQLNVKMYDEMIKKYGLESRGVQGGFFEISLDALANSFNDPTPVLEEFKKAAQDLIKRGAEVILPGCGLLNLITVENKMTQVDGATVLDVSGALMKTAEAMIILDKVSGVKISRRGFYESPTPQQIEAVRAIYNV